MYVCMYIYRYFLCIYMYICMYIYRCLIKKSRKLDWWVSGWGVGVGYGVQVWRGAGGVGVWGGFSEGV